MTRRRKRTIFDSPVWDCAVCIQQFLGGPRCFEHNPTPEERQTNPERYRRERYVPSRKKAT